MNAAVSVTELTRTFGAFVAVDRISFEIARGAIWGFLGPNGSGKSTTIRMLCGVLAPTAGRALVLGFDVARDPEAVKLRIGYMSQGSSLWGDLTVEEHLTFYAGLFGVDGRHRAEAVERWLERTALTAFRHELAGALAGGIRKRVALACTLLHEPEILFLDEPTSGVDPVSRREFWDIITSLADAGTTVMVTTHYLDEAEHCDQLAFIYRGKVIARGSPAEVKRADGVGITLEVLSARNSELIDVLDGAPGVRSASLYGAALHVTVESENDVAAVRALVERAGVRPDSFEPVTPSLEDVFAGLVTLADRSAA